MAQRSEVAADMSDAELGQSAHRGDAGDEPDQADIHKSTGPAKSHPSERDTTPALGTRGEPGRWERGVQGARVALHKRGFGDGRWSFLYGGDTRYGADSYDEAEIAAASDRARQGDGPDAMQGPMMNPAVWTWEVPLYFWFGGIAAGSSFVALACDLSGDHRSARIARRVALAALMPSPPLLILDLGRPERFYNMLRVFKPRSPMSMGAWALSVFGGLAAASVGADLIGREREARVIGGANAVVGSYLGSYTGVLLASTAVPLWARSRMFLGPIFVTTAVATGAAATRLTLVAAGLPDGHRTRHALGRVETAAIAVELGLSTWNEQRLGDIGDALEQGSAGRLVKFAKWSVRGGLALRAARPRLGSSVHHVASVMYLAGGLAFRYAWVKAGHNSATDDRAVAWMARHHTGEG
jgi:formate-dependent nitrite reductase membrane component NrfD